jgi:murein L,D-transpeptidase YafK
MRVPAVLRMVLTLALAAGGGETAARRLDRVPEMAPAEEQASVVVMLKGERRLILRRGEVEIAAYDIALGFEPEGHKRREGDGRTPEGRYVIDWRNSRSAFHLSLHISYPDAADSAVAEAGESPGGMIMIHGLPPGLRWLGAAHALRDWTAGCIAVTSEEIEAIWRLVPDGTPIEILP